MEPTGAFRLPFWSALQLHHFLHSLQTPGRFDRRLSTFEEYCSEDGVLTQVLSKTYSLLISPPEHLHLPWLEKWEKEMNRTFTRSQQQNIVRFSLKSSICTKIQESNYKILTRWYHTPQMLHKFYPEMPGGEGYDATHILVLSENIIILEGSAEHCSKIHGL